MLNKYFDNIINKSFITKGIFYGSLLDKWLKTGYEENSLTYLLILTDNEKEVMSAIRNCILIPFSKAGYRFSEKMVLEKDNGFSVTLWLRCYTDNKKTVMYCPSLTIDIINIESFGEMNPTDYDNRYYEAIIDINDVDGFAIEEVIDKGSILEKVENVLRGNSSVFTNDITLYYERV